MHNTIEKKYINKQTKKKQLSNQGKEVEKNKKKTHSSHTTASYGRFFLFVDSIYKKNNK